MGVRGIKSVSFTVTFAEDSILSLCWWGNFESIKKQRKATTKQSLGLK